MTAARLLRYVQFLSSFDYKVRYHETSDHADADFPSRFPLADTSTEDHDITVVNLEQIEILPVTRTEIAHETTKNEDLKPVYDALLAGSTLQDTIFAGKESEFSLERGCIFRGI